MSGTLIDLIIQIVAGVIGGYAAGATLKDWTLGAVGNTIAGAIGGVVGVHLLAQVMPALASTAGNVDAGALVGQVIAGAVGGAIFAIIAGVTKWMVMPPTSI
jgi:hypothetical protein